MDFRNRIISACTIFSITEFSFVYFLSIFVLQKFADIGGASDWFAQISNLVSTFVPSIAENFTTYVRKIFGHCFTLNAKITFLLTSRNMD
jgi:hypothetical protein